MRKFIVTILSIGLCVSLAGCSLPFGGGDDTSTAVPEPILEEGVTPIEETPTEETGTTEITVGTGMEEEVPVDGGEAPTETTETTEVAEEDNSKKSFREQHPYLFAFRFDGVNAYIDTAAYSQPEMGTPQSDKNTYTSMTADGLPGTLRVNNNLNGYSLTSDVNSSMGIFTKDGTSDRITVEYVDEGNISSEREKVSDTGAYSSYNFSETTYNVRMDLVSNVMQSEFEYTLRDGAEGSIPYGLIVSLENGNYLIIRNSGMSSNVTMDEIKSVYRDCLQWETE